MSWGLVGAKETWAGTVPAGAALIALLLTVAPASASAQDPTWPRLLAEEPAAPLVDTTTAARRVGEACIFGAAAGAAAAIIAGAPVAASGLAAPSVFSIALGAAAVGCTVGFVGATAASGFGIFWERQVLPELERPAGGGDRDVPEIRVSSDGGGWSIWRTTLEPVRGLTRRGIGE